MWIDPSIACLARLNRGRLTLGKLMLRKVRPQRSKHAFLPAYLGRPCDAPTQRRITNRISAESPVGIRHIVRLDTRDGGDKVIELALAHRLVAAPVDDRCGY